MESNDPPAANTRSRSRVAASRATQAGVSTATDSLDGVISSASEPHGTGPAITTVATERNGPALNLPSPPTASLTSPYWPSPVERVLLGVFPLVLLVGSAWSAWTLSTEVQTYLAGDHENLADVAGPTAAAVVVPYFAQKGNVVNQVFAKKAWAWTSAAFAVFVLASGRRGSQGSQRATGLAPGNVARGQAWLRWALVTGWWFVVTQWCFGPALIDRGFLWTGGICEQQQQQGDDTIHAHEHLGIISAVACKAVGGQWRGGHDISGHVFLMVLSSVFLLQEVGWVMSRRAGWRMDDRSVITEEGQRKEAAEDVVNSDGSEHGVSGLGVKMVAVVIALDLWMLLMTAMYFHTWFEKFTGLVTAAAGLYAVYVVPRVVPALRQVMGLPGV